MCDCISVTKTLFLSGTEFLPKASQHADVPLGTAPSSWWFSGHHSNLIWMNTVGLHLASQAIPITALRNKLLRELKVQAQRALLHFCYLAHETIKVW